MDDTPTTRDEPHDEELLADCVASVTVEDSCLTMSATTRSAVALRTPREAPLSRTERHAALVVGAGDGSVSTEVRLTVEVDRETYRRAQRAYQRVADSTIRRYARDWSQPCVPHQ